jgi:hypothetical protein
VVLEVDGIMIHSQEKGEDDFEAKLGIMYSGKELESKKAKHRRYRLKDKVVYAGIEGADDFGERLYIQGERKLSLSLARNFSLSAMGQGGLVILPVPIISKLPTSSTGGTMRRN